MDELSEGDKQLVARARKIEKFLSQNFHVAEQFTGQEGVYVKLEDTLRSFEEILAGKHDTSQNKLYLVGSIDEVVAKARNLLRKDNPCPYL